MGCLLFASAFIALALSFVNNDGALENLRFNLLLYDREEETAAVAATIRQYNRNSAGFYNSAGFPAGLDEIPAAPLLKRLIFQDIILLKNDGLVMVFDVDSQETKKVMFPRKNFAIAENEEVWAVALQDGATRRPVLGIKAVEVKVRYLLSREPFQGIERWIVRQVDVYPKNEAVPDYREAPAL